MYFRAGVRELWFMLLDRRQVEIHLPELGGETVRTFSAGEALTTAVLPDWSSPVAE